MPLLETSQRLGDTVYSVQQTEDGGCLILNPAGALVAELSSQELQKLEFWRVNRFRYEPGAMAYRALRHRGDLEEVWSGSVQFWAPMVSVALMHLAELDT